MELQALKKQIWHSHIFNRKEYDKNYFQNIDKLMEYVSEEEATVFMSEVDDFEDEFSERIYKECEECDSKMTYIDTFLHEKCPNEECGSHEDWLTYMRREHGTYF